LKTPGSGARTSKKNLTFGDDDDETMTQPSGTSTAPRATVLSGMFQGGESSVATPFRATQDPEVNPSRLFFQGSPLPRSETKRDTPSIPKHPFSRGPSKETVNVAHSIFGSPSTANTSSPFDYALRQGATKRQRQATPVVVSTTQSRSLGSSISVQRNRTPSPSASMAMITVQDMAARNFEATAARVVNPVPVTALPTDIPRCYLPEPPMPLRPSKRTAARARQSKTSEILKRVIREHRGTGLAVGDGDIHPRRDPADYMARSFRVSFGLAGLVVCPLQEFSEATGRDHHTVQFRSAPSCRNVPYLSVLKEQLRASEDERLAVEKQKELGDGDRAGLGGEEENDGAVGGDLPRFPLPTGSRLVSLMHRYKRCYATRGDEKSWHSKCVWALFNALFGREHDPKIAGNEVQYFLDNWPYGGLLRDEAYDDPTQEDVPGSIHRLRVRRKEAVRKWLEDAIRECPSIDATGRPSGGAVADGSSIEPLNVLGALTRLEVSKATELALEAGDFRLATLLSQSSGSPHVREYISQQLDMWKKWEVVGDRPDNSLIDEARLRVYLLLAGHLDDDRLKLKEFHWLQGLAMHFCFNHESKCGPNGSVLHGIMSFRNSFESGSDGGNGSSASVAIPRPWYHHRNGGRSGGAPLDSMYNLLMLAYNRGEDHSAALAENCSTDHLFEHHLTWHLVTAIQGLKLWEDAETLSLHRRTRLLSNYVEELEMAGLWHWAVYVALYLPDRVRAAATIQHLLFLHCPMNEAFEAEKEATLKRQHEDATREIDIVMTEEDKQLARKHAEDLAKELSLTWNSRKSFLLETLKIPERMLQRALALSARYSGRKHDEMVYHYGAQDWNPFHRCVIDTLMPECMFDRQYKSRLGSARLDLSFVDKRTQVLRDFVLTVKEKAENECVVVAWDTVGTVLDEYLSIEAIMSDASSPELNDPAQLLALFDSVVSLCFRLNELGDLLPRLQIHDHPVAESVLLNRILCVSEMAASAKNWFLSLSEVMGTNTRGARLGDLESLLGMPLTIEDKLHALRATGNDHLQIAVATMPMA
jgi:hypothetical protein